MGFRARVSQTVQRLLRGDASDASGILKSQQSRLDAIVAEAPCGIVGLTKDGDVQVANRRAQDILGLGAGPYPVAWPEGLEFLDPKTLEPQPEFNGAPLSVVSATQDGSRSFALRRSKCGAGTQYLKITSKPLVPSQTSPALYAMFVEEFTEQEVARQSLERAARLDALGQLTSGVAHDYNNLMTTIEYSLLLASSEDDAAERAEYLDTARRSIKRGTSLSTRLLAFAKPQAGLIQRVNLHEFRNEFLGLVRPSIQEGIQVTVSCDPDVPEIFCDAGGLENALLNLVINARDGILSARSHGRIEVCIRHKAQKGAVCFEVRDDGPGIPEDVVARIFDPFFTTKEAKGGSGLGLSMVYGFARQFGGDIAVDGGFGRGARISMTLPLGAVSAQPTAVSRQPSKALVGQPVLLVEDEEDLRVMTAKVISSFGCRVTETNTAEAALEALLRAPNERPILVTDVVLPGAMDGHELARRARHSHQDLPAIFLSGYSEDLTPDLMGPHSISLQKPCPAGHLQSALTQLSRAALT